ncbi:hypothetical protein [uncultured Desulfobacter sp.]|uniref:hypothetical protein n=1 Tax=uncultured Desulfobacter sp. TaxID=240139 RepID=UPI0029C7C74D|nr:hypothetical protein [uncultured Desulfobacter sp.]
MADSIREKIIQAIVTRAGQIRVVNGYNSDVGESTIRATRYANPGTLQQVVIIPRVESSEKTRFQKMTHNFPVDIHAFVAMTPGADNASQESEAVYTDLISAMTRTDTPCSILVDSITHTGGGGVEIADNETKLAGATATFEIVYTTDIGNPFFYPAALVDSQHYLLIDGFKHNLLI